MTLTTAEMRAAIAAQRQDDARCPDCNAPLWTMRRRERLCDAMERSLDRHDGGDWPDRPPSLNECRVCSTDVDIRWTEAHNREYDRWRNRHDEANVWEEAAAHDLWGKLDDKERAFNERHRRPRAIVEEGPEPGSKEAKGLLAWVEMELSAAHRGSRPATQWNDPASTENADARVGHTSRDVPAFTEVDRYDPETGVPKRAYMGVFTDGTITDGPFAGYSIYADYSVTSD